MAPLGTRVTSPSWQRWWNRMGYYWHTSEHHSEPRDCFWHKNEKRNHQYLHCYFITICEKEIIFKQDRSEIFDRGDSWRLCCSFDPTGLKCFKDSKRMTNDESGLRLRPGVIHINSPSFQNEAYSMQWHSASSSLDPATFSLNKHVVCVKN